MKKTTLLAMLLGLLAFSTLKAQVNGETWTAKGSGEVTGASREVLYNRYKLWLAQAYKSGNLSVLIDDRAQGLGSVRACFFVPRNKGRAWGVTHTLVVQITDGKYQYQLECHQIIANPLRPNATRNKRFMPLPGPMTLAPKSPMYQEIWMRKNNRYGKAYKAVWTETKPLLEQFTRSLGQAMAGETGNMGW